MIETTAEPGESRRNRVPLWRIVSALLPPLVTLLLTALLVFTIFFDLIEWQWIAFLSGILVAAILSLVSTSLKSQWAVGQRTQELGQIKERLAAETVMHQRTSEQLARELALHQQDRTRHAKEVEAHRTAVAEKLAAQGMLGMLALNLEDTAFVIDRERRCRFHTRRFAAWTGLPSPRLDGAVLEEALPPLDAEALRPALLDALDGRAGRVEILFGSRESAEQRAQVDYLPQRDATGAITGALVLIRQAQDPAAAASPDGDHILSSEAERGATGLVVTDDSGNAVYLNSLTEELSGWDNPQERIRQAIHNNGFDLFAQDIVALQSQSSPALMAELLIRMRDEEQNLVPPGTFLPIAERFGMMPEIDRLVVRKAIAAQAAAGASSDAPRYAVLCINLARSSIEDPTFPEFVARALQERKLRGDSLCFELSDGDAIACLPGASRLAYVLKPFGCRFSLDGFGRMRVGFDHVKTLPLNFLKIDGSIILQILRSPEALTKVKAIQRVCKASGIRTIAEMVEDMETRETLRATDVDFVQGFGIVRPHPFP